VVSISGAVWTPAIARRAIEKIQRLMTLRDDYRQRFARGYAPRLGDVIDQLFSGPVQTITSIANVVGVGFKTARRMVHILEEAGVLEETTGKRRNRIFLAPEIMRLLEE